MSEIATFVAQVEALVVPPGGLLVVHLPTRWSDAETLELRRALGRLCETRPDIRDAGIVVIQGDVQLEAVDADLMWRAGWVRA